MEREVFGVVRPRERAQAADDELGGVGEAVEDDDAEARGEQLQHGVARTRSRSRSETGQPAAGESSQTLAAVAAWERWWRGQGGASDGGAGAAVRRRRRRNWAA